MEQKKNAEKVKKYRKKRIYAIAGISFFVLIFSIYIIFYIFNKETLAVNDSLEEVLYNSANINKIDINSILENNIKDIKKEEIQTEEVDLEYTTIYQNNPNLSKGKIQVLQEGRDGKQKVITKKIYQGDVLVGEEQSGNIVTKASINKIVEIGTGEYSSSYKIKNGDTLYVTSYTLNVLRNPDIKSEKVITINKGDKVKVEEIKEDWYKISINTYTGWADKNCLTYIEEDYNEEITTDEQSKEHIIASLNKNMNLNKPSGLNLKQFKKILCKNEQDKNKIFEQNAEYFSYIEKQYNINGIFVAAVGIHESNWGTSKIALSKKNLFGYGASDSSPYDNAYTFANYAEGIDLIARVFTKYYLNPSGTKIYDGQIASGKYYTSPTLESINKRYASDKNWNNSVYKWMNYLYNRL